ncbi:MAG: energy-coupling factor transporter transmembrane component T family protein [Promethearchaeota archaeon]
MKTELPFRLENERPNLKKIHPLIRFIIPFIFVIPFIIIDDIYLIFSILLVVFLTALVLRLKILEIFSRMKIIIPLVFLLTIFIPLYVGDTVLYQFDIGNGITIFKEGLILASLILFRVLGAFFVFMSFFSSLTYSEFIEALTKLRIPSIFVGSLIVMLHYIPILAQSNKKILEAQEMRGKNISTYPQKLKTHAYIMGKSIVTNMERSEKLYESLKMRGFSGKITFVTRKLTLFDLGLLFFFTVVLFFFIFVFNLQAIYQGVITLILP